MLFSLYLFPKEIKGHVDDYDTPHGTSKGSLCVACKSLESFLQTHRSRLPSRPQVRTVYDYS